MWRFFMSASHLRREPEARYGGRPRAPAHAANRRKHAICQTPRLVSSWSLLVTVRVGTPAVMPPSLPVRAHLPRKPQLPIARQCLRDRLQRLRPRDLDPADLPPVLRDDRFEAGGVPAQEGAGVEEEVYAGSVAVDRSEGLGTDRGAVDREGETGLAVAVDDSGESPPRRLTKEA
jgi:hypothetical protein